MALATSSGNNQLHSNDLSELADILSADYSEDGIFKHSKSICLRTSGRTGIGFLTPNDMISRINGFVRRKAEDMGVRNMESFRHISDIVGVIVPQVSFPAELTLSLVDSAFPLEAMGNQMITVSSSDGPCLFVFNCSHSIPNEDRISVNGAESHRRLGLMYQVDTDLPPSGHVTTFTVTPLWREAHSQKPGFNRIAEPQLYPIKVGFKKSLILKTHAQLKSSIERGMITIGHVSKPDMPNANSKEFDLTRKVGAVRLGDHVSVAIDQSEVNAPLREFKHKPTVRRITRLNSDGKDSNSHD
nr:movememt protein [Solanum violifolium ringspot virus]